MHELIAIVITVVILCLVASPFIAIVLYAGHRAKQQKKVWDAADKYLKSN
jgi:Na+-transporting NADH:ubiquinone oxidoreductase subunit NqrC